MGDTPDDLREQEIRRISRYLSPGTRADFVFLLHRLDEARADSAAAVARTEGVADAFSASWEKCRALQARLDAAMRVVEAARRLVARGLLHGSSSGRWQRLEGAVELFDAAMKEPKLCPPNSSAESASTCSAIPGRAVLGEK